LKLQSSAKAKTAVPVVGISVYVIAFALLAVALSSSAFFHNKKTRIKGTSATVSLLPQNTSFGFLKPRDFPGTVDL